VVRSAFSQSNHGPQAALASLFRRLFEPVFLAVIDDRRLDRVLARMEQWIFTGGSASSSAIWVFLIVSA